MGSVSRSNMTRILMLGILLMALRGLRTRTVRIAERLSFSTSRQYSRALEVEQSTKSVY